METQQSIAGWCWQVFGQKPESVEIIVDRCIKELREMGSALEVGDHQQVMAEAVDMAIILHHLAEYLGYDLQASIDAKMAINRSRTWVRHGNGDGRHVPAGPEPQYCVPIRRLPLDDAE